MNKDEQIKKLKEQLQLTNSIIHNMIVADQSAYIAYKNGDIDNAFEWIENGLFGPGHLPENNNNLTPQKWYDTNSVEVFGHTTQ